MVFGVVPSLGKTDLRAVAHGRPDAILLKDRPVLRPYQVDSAEPYFLHSYAELIQWYIAVAPPAYRVIDITFQGHVCLICCFGSTEGRQHTRCSQCGRSRYD